jgi:hypothetical protein
LRINDTGPTGPYADRPLLASVAKGPDAEVLVDLLSGIANTNNIVLAPPGLSQEQLEPLVELFASVAPKLATADSGIEPAEAVAFSRDEVLAHIGRLFANRVTVAGAFNRSQTCGQALADGGSCS